MTTGNSDTSTMKEMQDRRFERVNVLIQESINKITTDGGKGPFLLSILRGREMDQINKTDVIHDTNVEYVNGEWRWNRTDLRERIANVDACVLLFDDNGRTHNFPIYLDEPTKSTEVPTPGTQQETQHSKPATART